MYLSRRDFIKGSAAACLSIAAGPYFTQMVEAAEKGGTKSMKFEQNLQVPYSIGRDVPTISVPEGACDVCHHIYDPVRFPYLPDDIRNQPPATVDVYRMLQRKLGLTRNVIIQPSAYGTDNRCLTDALKQMGKRNSRAIAVVDEKISNQELEKMDKQGVCGIRYNVSRGADFDSVKILKMADRIKDMGWNMHFWMPADTTVAIADTLYKLSVPIVFDHRGHLPKGVGIEHPAFGIITRLMGDGKAWVKLSALYHDSKLENDYIDTVAVGKAYVDFEPKRVLWGTDWPHPSEVSARKELPNDAHLLDLLAKQAPDEKIRNQILVDNPAELYHFK
jgi:D-galactarolactone isomerase